MHKISLHNTYRKSCCLTKLALDTRCMSLINDNGDSKMYITNQDKEQPTRPVYTPESVSIDDPPTTCCMSGCHNCVYIAWAEALSKKMATADPAIAEKILEKVDDPGMQAFLKMELRNMGILKR